MSSGCIIFFGGWLGWICQALRDNKMAAYALNLRDRRIVVNGGYHSIYSKLRSCFAHEAYHISYEYVDEPCP